MKNKITVEEMLINKKELESNISKLCSDFKSITGLDVNGVEFSYMIFPDNTKIITSVNVKIEV